MKNYIHKIKQKVLSEEKITFEEAIELANIDENDTQSLDILFAAANEIRQKFVGNKVDLCTILNAKSGKCSENCKYCAQSAHHSTGVIEYELLEYEKVLEKAIEAEKQGTHRFSLVTSGRGINSDKELEKLAQIYEKLKKDTNLKLCASHGIISYQQAKRLKEAGVSMYHHNVETSSSHYSNICTTHTYQDRINTIKNVREAGLEVCCGGIIGMSESLEERIKMAFEIKGLGVKSIPINVLNPIKGTPLEDMDTMSPMEVLKTMAIVRFIIPDSYIRYAGGRMALKDKQDIGFRAGVNAALIGNYLTTTGSNVDEDKKMIICAGLEI